MGKLGWMTFGVMVALAAPLAAPLSAQSVRLIPLVDGRTCHPDRASRCFQYSASSRRATRAGFGNVRVSPKLEVKPGFITDDGFVQIERAISRQTGGQAHGR